MNRKSKVFFLVFFSIIIGSMATTYYRYMVVRDYIVQAEAECDPYTETCFIYVCDPSADEECTGDPVEDTSYYKIIQRNAKNIPMCDPAAEECDALVCPAGEADCEMMMCDPTQELEGTCSDPIAYTDEHPVEEEMMEDGEVSEEDVTGEDTVSEEESVTEDTMTREASEATVVEAAGEVSGVAAETEQQEGGI